MRSPVSMLLASSAWISAGACGGDGSAAVGPEDPDSPRAIHAVEIVPPQQFMSRLGFTKQIRAQALDEGGTVLYGDSEPRFSWSSSAPGVVTVDQAGRLTSVGWGTAIVTATAEGVSASTRVTVRDAFRVAWFHEVPGGVHAGNVMAADGTIYVGNSTWEADSSAWYAITPEGSTLWTLSLPYYAASTIPAIGDDGTLYLASWYHDDGGRLIAIDAGGSIRWVLEDLERLHSSPALGPGGTIYVPGRSRVYAVGALGEIEWTYEAHDDVFFVSAPAVASDGTIYLGGEDRRLYALGPDGSLRWTFEAGDRIRSSPSIGADGTIYFGSHDGRLYAVHPDGTLRWRVELRCGLPWGCLDVDGSPSIGPDGTVYVMVDGVYAVDPDGEILWHFPANPSRAAPILGADGTVYVASSYPLLDGNGRGRVFALDQQGDLLWEHRTEGEAGGSPLIGLDGTIFAAASGGLIAIVEHETTNGGYAGAPWPSVRGNRASAGRVGG